MSNNGIYEVYVNHNRHRLEEVLPLDTPIYVPVIFAILNASFALFKPRSLTIF